VLRRVVADDVPLAPVHAAVHARLTAIEPGRADTTLPAPGADPDAALWLLGDFASGLAVTGTLDAGERITTLRLTLHVLTREIRGGTLHAVGCLDDRPRGVALSTAVITDDAGRTIARAHGRNAVLADEVAAGYGAEVPSWAPAPLAVDQLVRDAVAPHDQAVNTAAVVQGGALASLPARALAEVLEGPADEASAVFLRPVPADGRTVHAEAELEHGGRRLRSGRALLRDDRARVVLSVSGLRYG
jgi:acyl-coenzyme A thioesterase PaaI-like protein